METKTKSSKIKSTKTNKTDGFSTDSIRLLPQSPISENTELTEILTVMEKLLHWAAIIESSDDAIISKSMDGKITSWNRGAEKLYGYTAKEVLGKPVSILMPSEKENDFPYIIGQLHQGKKIEHYETKRKTKYGKILDVSITVSPIKDSQGSIIGASKIARDISDKVEQERRREEFLSTVSHELKTPVATQKIYGELIEKIAQDSGNTQLQAYVKKLNNQTEKMNKLVNDLLELSRLQRQQLSMEFIQFPIADVLHEAADDLERSSNHKIIVNSSPDHIVWGDKDRISQVVINLLSNAIKYSPKSKDIIVSSTVKDNSIITSVQDYGLGIDKTDHNKIFERFYRVAGKDEQTYPGMGIGLNFCQEVISRHGGSIWVESQLKKGATFYFTVPSSAHQQI